MPVWTDNTGRSWSIVIDPVSLKRVKDLAGVNLVADLVDAKLFSNLATDPVLLCAVLYALCKPQADAANVTPEQFGHALTGDAVGAATDALLEGLIDFFPNPRRRMVLRKSLVKMHEIDELELRLADERVEGLTYGGSSGNLLGSSGSTPAT